MFKKIMLVLTLLLVGLFFVSSVSASDNQTIITDDADDILASNANDDELINQENTYEVSNDDSDKLNDTGTLTYSYENEGILDSPSYNAYTVKVNDVTKSYDKSEYITMTISPATLGYGYRYDFYLKIFDSNNVEKVSKRYYNMDPISKELYNVGSKSLDPGVYSIKILNYADNHEMASAKLTVKSTPYSAYSVSVSNTNILYKTSTKIIIKVSPASSYYYKYDFYLKIYDSKNVEKFSKRYYSTTSSTVITDSSRSSDWAPGVYTAKIINNVDNYVMDTAKFTVVSVPYSAYSVSVSDCIMDYGVGGDIAVSISPASSSYLKYDFYLKIYDSNNVEKYSKRYYNTTSSNKVTYNVGPTSLDPGIYSIKIINVVDNHVMANSKLTLQSVPYSAYSVSVSNTNLNYGIGGNIDIGISPASSGYLKYDFYLKIYDSNNVEKVSKRYYNTTASKKVTYTIGATRLNQGTYTIKIINNDGGHVMKIATLNIDKTTIESTDLTGDCDKIIQYKVRVAKNNEFKNGLKVTFSCNGKEYTNVTDSNGYAYLNIHLAAGNYSITTKCNGAVNINKLFINTVYVDNAYTGMHIDSVTTYYGTVKTINYGWEGYFKGSLNIYKGSTLIKSINLDTSKCVDSCLNYDKYSKSISTSILKDAAKYTLKITDINGSVVAQSTVTIKKIPTELLVGDVGTFKNIKDTIHIILWDKKNDEYINGNVNVKINGKTYTAKVKNGEGKITIKTPSKYKRYSCTAVYKGDDIYAASSEKFTLYVEKYDSDVIVSDISKVKSGSKIKLKANVYYNWGTKRPPSGVVKFKVNGKIYKVKIKNGVAKVTIKAPKKAKTYICNALYSGTKNIEGSSTKFKITVKKATITKKKTTTKKTSNKKKITKFTVVVPTKLYKKISRSYGNYKVVVYKCDETFIEIIVYKNNKPLKNFKAKYVYYTTSGKKISVKVGGNYWYSPLPAGTVLKTYKVKATVWPKN